VNGIPAVALERLPRSFQIPRECLGIPQHVPGFDFVRIFPDYRLVELRGFRKTARVHFRRSELAQQG
jgi:hypothetical protein